MALRRTAQLNSILTEAIALVSIDTEMKACGPIIDACEGIEVVWPTFSLIST